MKEERDRSSLKTPKSNKALKVFGSIAIGASIVVVLTLLFAFTDINTIGFSEKISNGDKPYSAYLENELLGDFPDCPEKTDRGYLPRKMFCQLPDMPSDYKEWEVLYEFGKVNDLETIEEEVWCQPEFSVAWTGQIVEVLQNPNPDRIGASYFPQVDNTDSGITIPRGGNGRVNFMMRNTPLSIFFLGIKLIPDFPASQVLEYESLFIETTQDPEVAEKCFDVTITPNQFALAPSFPVFVYTDEERYMRMIKVDIQVSEDCPPGDYIISVNPVTPDDEFNDMYLRKEFRGKKILTKYAKVGGYVGISRPFFRAFVTVE